MTRRPPWQALDRSGTALGELLETHEDGYSFEALEAYRGRFPAFCRDLFNLQLTPQQLEGAEALREHRQVLIVGANGTGKDTLSAAWSLFEVYVMGGLALLSGPTDRQVREVLMRREVGRLWRAAGGKLPGERYEMAIRIPGREEGGLLAFTASDPERFVGHHSALGRVFIGLTESQGISSEIFEAARRCQPNLLLAVCNPVSPAVPVYEFSRSTAWRTLNWSALRHPNVITGDPTVVPGAVTREWVNAVRAEFGGESRFWQSAVLAVFPDQSESALISAEAWDAADDPQRAEKELSQLRRDQALGRAARAVLSVDVAREGPDSSAAALRWGGVLLRLERYREVDAIENARRIAALVRQLINPGSIPVGTVVVDEVALGGGVLDQLTRDLREVGWHQPVMSLHPTLHWVATKAVGFKSSRRAPSPERFVDTRSQSFWHLRDEVERGELVIHPQVDRGLLGELREEILAHDFTHGGDDRIRILPKDEIRGRVGRSPDLADALSMSYLPVLQSSKRKKVVTFR